MGLLKKKECSTERLGKPVMAQLAGYCIPVLLIVGCFLPSSTAVMRRIRPRAAFDLACDEKQVEVVRVEGDTRIGTFGATGCGRRIRYEVMCGDLGQCTIQANVAGRGVPPNPTATASHCVSSSSSDTAPDKPPLLPW